MPLDEALAHDAGSVPQPAAEAAGRLSRWINHTQPSYDPMVSSLDDMNDTTDPTTRHPPFIESIKLGRMG